MTAHMTMVLFEIIYILNISSPDHGLSSRIKIWIFFVSFVINQWLPIWPRYYLKLYIYIEYFEPWSWINCRSKVNICFDMLPQFTCFWENLCNATWRLFYFSFIGFAPIWGWGYLRGRLHHCFNIKIHKYEM